MCLKYLLYLHSIFEYTTQNNFLRSILYNCLSKKIGSLHNNVPSLKAVLHFFPRLWTLIWKVVVTPHSSYLFSFFFFFFFFDPISLSEQILYAEDVCFEKACHQFHHLLLHFHPSCCPNIFTKNRLKARYILTVHAAPNLDKNAYCSVFYSTHSFIWMKKLSSHWLPSHLYLFAWHEKLETLITNFLLHLFLMLKRLPNFLMIYWEKLTYSWMNYLLIYCMKIST